MKQKELKEHEAKRGVGSKRTKIRIGSLAMCAVLIVSILTTMMPVASAASQEEINTAITNGLAYLATQQQADGQVGPASGFWGLGATSEAVLAFENEGNLPGSGNTYSANVEKGLDYLFTYAQTVDINTQPAGNPDTDGDGHGVWFNAGNVEILYTTSIAAMAIVGSNSPDRVVTNGPLAGQTYKEVITDVVDLLAWSQNEAGYGRGGWRYTPNVGDSDNSVSQWPVLALISAEQWDISAPSWVKEELNYWISYIQAPNGASGYTSPGDWDIASPMARTGALLVEMYYYGDTATTPRVQNAVNFLDANWAANHPNGNFGNPYGMYAIFKGLDLLEIATLPNTGDWFSTYTAWLVKEQLSTGGWPKMSYYANEWLDTDWAILILQGTIFPVEAKITVPACAWTTGYEVKVDYKVERFNADGTLTIYKDDNQIDQVTLTDFKGSATYTKTIEPDTAGTHTYKAVLNVKAGTTEAQSQDTGSVKVYQAPTVSGIPDQTAPFTTFDLDSFLTVDPAATVTWAASGNDKLVVSIDSDNVATVTAPSDASAPETIIFTATAKVCTLSATASDSATFTPMIPVTIDIQPGAPGTIGAINLAKKNDNPVTPVAILGSKDFDVTKIDPTSLTFGASADASKEAKVVKTSLEDVNGDGFMDMMAFFTTQDTGFNTAADSTTGYLNGKLLPEFGGVPIMGSDSVKVIAK